MDLDIGAWVFDTVKKRRGNRNELITYDKFTETGNKTQSGAGFFKSLQWISAHSPFLRVMLINSERARARELELES